VRGRASDAVRLVVLAMSAMCLARPTSRSTGSAPPRSFTDIGEGDGHDVADATGSHGHLTVERSSPLHGIGRMGVDGSEVADRGPIVNGSERERRGGTDVLHVWMQTAL